MLGKLAANERELFRIRLEDLINPHHELVLLSKRIGRAYFESRTTRNRERRVFRYEPWSHHRAVT